jgi:hypothetical protein
MKLCPECGIEKRDTCFNLSMNGKRRNLCKACSSKKGRIRRRLELFEAFGWKCQCCGENHPDFLTLEHIDGKNHYTGPNSTQRVTEQEIYHAKKHGFNPEFFSLLCMNCNFAKGHWGKCPHETGETPEQAIEAMRMASKSIRYGDRINKTAFKSGPDARRTKGQFKEGFDGRRPSEQVVQ